MLGSDATIFVIDDDQAVRDSLQVLLELHGLRVVSFASGEAFLQERSRRGEPAKGCLLLDLDLAGTSGLDLLRALRREGLRLPVIIITGRGAEALQRAREAGALAVLEKPFFDGALISIIDRALGAA